MLPIEPYAVVPVPVAARIGDEPMGTKEKFWFKAIDGDRYLFKLSRTGTGEHWAEKVGSEIGHLLGVPCAPVELASANGSQGCVVRSFAARGTALVHGNELLQRVDETYPVALLRGVAKHTVQAVLDVLAAYSPPLGHQEPTLPSAADWFVGYLLLDALIMNSDRHHENWAVVQHGTGRGHLAPSYDHASSLGRELRDERRIAVLQRRSRGHSMPEYVARGRSALYRLDTDSAPLHPFAAYQLAASTRANAGSFWQERLQRIDGNDLSKIVGRIPSTVISEPGRLFALELLAHTKRELS